MSNRLVKAMAIVGLAASMAAPTARADQKACGGDNKLIGDSGLIRLATDLAPDSWWGITFQGLSDAGYATDQQKLNFLNSLIGTSFPNLSDMAAHLVNVAASFDINGNSLVCVANVRGTRTSLGDPNFAFYFFFVGDDKEFNNPN